MTENYEMCKRLSFFVIFVVHKAVSQHELIITPEVTIVDEKPSIDTGRIEFLPNKTVNVRALIGENVILICNIFNMYSKSRVIWRRVSFDGSQTETVNDALMSRDMSRWKIGQGKQTNSLRLEILSVDQTYEGYYTCDCQYTGSVEPARAERVLYVVAKPSILPFHSSYATTVTEGDRTVLRCQASGIPTPVIFWTRTGGSTSIIRNYGESKPGETIVFNEIIPSDGGEYMCKAENNLGSDFWPIQLTVKHKPRLRIFAQRPMPRISCNLQLICEVTANPPPNEGFVSWMVASTGQTIKDGPRIRMVYLNAGEQTRFLTLSFEPILSSDLKIMYTCVAANMFGTTTLDFILTDASVSQGVLGGLNCDAALSRCCFHLLVFIVISSIVILS